MKSPIPLKESKKEDYKPLDKFTGFADFETKGLGGDFICGAVTFMESDEIEYFFSVENFLEIIKERELKLVYFHNLEYDGRYILNQLMVMKIKFTLINRVSKLLAINFNDIKIIDSYALLTDSLKNLSRVFAPKYEKKTLDLQNIEFNPDNQEHMDYLAYDVLALKHVLINARKIIHDLFGVNAKMTTSSTALRAWTTTLKDKVLFRLSAEADEFVRKSYFGGLVYQKNIDVYENVYIFDFNSMYPSVMRDFKFPYSKPYFTDEFEGSGFYQCDIDASKAKFLFINGYVDGKKKAKASGNFEAYITDHEYRLGIKLGYKIKIKRGLCFLDKAYLFKDFVNMCEQIRLNNSKNALDGITKLVQNSLYGKFGTKQVREQIIYSPDIEEDLMPFLDEYTGEFFGLYIQDVDAVENYMLPHLASYTTSLARCRLVEAIIECGIENVVYADTDSIFVLEDGKASAEKRIGLKYGMVKLEKYCRYILILAPKLYFTKDKNRAKGFPKHVIEHIKFQLVSGEKGSASFTSLNSNGNILKRRKEFYKTMTRTLPILSENVLEKIKSIGIENL